MGINSTWVALFVSVPITVISIITVSYIGKFSPSEITATGFIILLSSYVFSFSINEWLIFRRVKEIKTRLAQLINKYESRPEGNGNPLKEIYRDLELYDNKNKIEISRLRKLADFRKEFIADVSHELKTPIFAAQGFVHTLMDGAINDKSVRDDFLKKAAKSLDGLDLLVQDLVTLSHLEIGEIRMNFEYFDIYQLCLEIFDQFERRAIKKDITLGFEDNTAENEILVYADQRRISQILTNLVSNALKYTNEGDVVKVGFEIDEEKTLVYVRDSGIGISEKDIPKIFQRFYRVDKSRSRKQGGTGLGLAIVKHIIELHDTNIEVESEEGKGTKFSFKLLRTSPGVFVQNNELTINK